MAGPRKSSQPARSHRACAYDRRTSMSEPTLYAAKQNLDLQFYGHPQNYGPGSTFAILDARRSPEDIGALLVLSDLALCDRLVRIGITGSTAAALALVPVVEVAWADAKIQDGERAAILGEAKTDYGFAHPESRPLLEYWLKNRPTPQMMTAWVHFVRALGRMLSPGDQDDLRDSLIHLCRGVAEADGGVFGKVSGSEKKVLEQIQAAFDREQSA